MGDFFIVSLITITIIAICCLISYEIMRATWKVLPKLELIPHFRVLVIIAPIFLTHIIDIWIYAITYFTVENFTAVGAVQGVAHTVGLTKESFLDCLYFSASTYTSLGFGDLIPTHHMRMLAAAEVLNGLVLIAWTASFTYLAMEKFWPLHHGKKH